MTFPRVLGTGRMADNPKAVLLALEREPTDDELRAIHDALASGDSRVAPAPRVDDDKAKAVRGEVGDSRDSHLEVGGEE